MWPTRSLLLLLAAQFCTAQPSILETLIASNSIGAHFGPPSIDASFDYVVIGGGTAGITIATRLAAESGLRVALVEAGSLYELTNGNFSQVPVFVANFVGAEPSLENPLVDWVQRTEPVEGFGGRRVLYTTGKTLGGSSARNYMLYTRSPTGAHSRWAEEVDDESYTYENFEPYMKRSVLFEPPNDELRLSNSTPQYSDESFEPRGGPLRVTYPNFSTSFATWIELSLSELGLDEVNGFVDGNVMGYSYSPFTIDSASQLRSSSESSFLRYALEEVDNLLVYQQTIAQRILFDADGRASGVVVNSGGRDYRLNATREVIVSCGAFRSPQLLMVSGIGPRSTLSQHNIPLVADLPGVGQNLQDHVTFGIGRAVSLVTHSALAFPQYAAQQLQLFLSSPRTGALTSTGGELLGFEKLPPHLRSTLSPETQAGLDANPPDWPDIEFLVQDAYAGNYRDFLTTIPPDPSLNYGTVGASLVAPFSRGNVTINSTDTRVNPVLQPGWLSDPRDREVAVAAFRRVREVWAAEAVRGVLVGDEAFPGANVTTDEEILSAIRGSAITVYHAASTCKMGRADDGMAVVDGRARVLGGVSGLRVVDASVLPFLPPGHPQATIYGLAEKIAEDILGGDA